MDMPERVDSPVGGVSRKVEEGRPVRETTLFAVVAIVLACCGLGLYFLLGLFMGA
jgi:hypothetical protein